jgi:hypothetical protein
MFETERDALNDTEQWFLIVKLSDGSEKKISLRHEDVERLLKADSRQKEQQIVRTVVRREI